MFNFHFRLKGKSDKYETFFLLFFYFISLCVCVAFCQEINENEKLLKVFQIAVCFLLKQIFAKTKKIEPEIGKEILLNNFTIFLLLLWDIKNRKIFCNWSFFSTFFYCPFFQEIFFLRIEPIIIKCSYTMLQVMSWNVILYERLLIKDFHESLYA